MALFLLTGLSNCPYFAQLEHDFHHVSSRVPDLIITKRSFLDAEDFQKFKAEHPAIKNSAYNDENNALPVILREYANINGRSRVIGGFSEAREYLSEYYNYNEMMNTSHIQQVAAENYQEKMTSSEKTQQQMIDDQNKLVHISVFDTDEPNQLSYHFIPLLIRYFEQQLEKNNFYLNINIIYSYDDSKALALKMELEDCAYQSLANIDLYKISSDENGHSSVPTGLNKNMLKSKYVFIFDNINIAENLAYDQAATIIIHQITDPSNLIQNNLKAIQNHTFCAAIAESYEKDSGNLLKNVISTINFTYENVAKSVLARELSGVHAGTNFLHVRSTQINNVGIYGVVGESNKWQIDFSKTSISGLENSAISLENDEIEFDRPLKDILVNKKFLEGSIQKSVDERILSQDVSKRLLSEAKSILHGFSSFLKNIETHYITSASNGMSLPHAFSSEKQIICLGLQGIANEKVREDVVDSNASNVGNEGEKKELVTDGDSKNFVSEQPSEPAIQEE